MVYYPRALDSLLDDNFSLQGRTSSVSSSRQAAVCCVSFVLSTNY